MSKFTEKEIALSKLSLDSDNSRYPYQLDSQREMLEWMTSGEKHIGDKIFTLAKDIAEFGLNPAERIMVSPDPVGDDRYIVLEGNRRVTALKLLSNPDTAPDSKWRSRYTQLCSIANYKPEQRVACVVANDEAAAFHFMEIKHLGESGGAGVVPWGSEEKARHQKRQNQKSREHKALALLDHVRNSELYDAKTKENAGIGFPITNLDRILGDKDFREFIGLKLDEDRELAFDVDPVEASKPITKIIDDLGSGDKKVGDLINKDKRHDYQRSFAQQNKPDNNQRLKQSIKVADSEKASAKAFHKKKQGRKTNPYEGPKDRKKLLLRGTTIPIDARRYNRQRRILDELKSLPLQKLPSVYPNAIACLFRTFFEVSVDTFVDGKKLPPPSHKGWKDVSLTERAKIVKDYMKKNDLLSSDQIKALNKVLANKSATANPNTLNDFVHNVNNTPDAKSLIDVWDKYVVFLSRIWEELDKS